MEQELEFYLLPTKELIHEEKLVEKAFLTKDNFDENFENFVSNASHKTEELITLLEEKLAALKLKNAKFQK